MTTLARITLLSASILALGAASAHAQSAEQKVDGYVPPPLFGAPPIAQPRPQGANGAILVPGRSSTTRDISDPIATTGAPHPPVNGATPSGQGDLPAYVKPRVSRDNVDGPLQHEPYIPKFPPLAPVPMEETPRGRGEIVERPRAPLNAPIPQKKPSTPAQPSSAPAPIETPVAAMPQPAPPAAASAPDKFAAPVETPVAMPPDAQPAQKVTSKGVVTGPKTMPSVGVGGVEKLETFTPEPASEKTLLEQHSERQQQLDAPPPEKEAVKELPALPAGFTPVAQIEAVDASNSKMSLSFASGQAELNDEQRLTVLHNLVPILSGDAGQRLMIQSYATPDGKGQSSDRRIALSRALAIRAALLEQGIEARRIDVRALGAVEGQSPADRTDLILTSR